MIMRHFKKNLRFMALIFSLFLPTISYSAEGPCFKNCEPTSCEYYSLDKTLQCLEDCEHNQSDHGRAVITNCQTHLDLLMSAKQQQTKFPSACGNATKYEAILNFVPMEGKIEQGIHGWKFTHWIPGRHGPERDIGFSISENVGEIGTGRGEGEVVLKSLTPENFVVMAHVDMETKTVMCLSTAYKLH